MRAVHSCKCWYYKLIALILGNLVPILDVEERELASVGLNIFIRFSIYIHYTIYS